QATMKGFSRLEVNEPVVRADIDRSWEVLAEAVQTVMRKFGMPEPYEQLKAATRGRAMDAQVYQDILTELKLPAAALHELKDLTPAAYLGLATELASNRAD
ncbi:MAG: adenylosuccinate lyase, partial [Pseudomonadales bacterium]